MTEKKSTPVMFGKANLVWMLISVLVIALGMLLMAGGGSNDPTVFNKDEVYSTLRITVAPIMILAGLGIAVYAIFKK